ncbi:olfactomedin-like protein 2B isoform X2 [Antennarius striatus]|uniref:olfactomedin-like protein 2B isoform X2 n=1 Tax=Antennarius striatus TaxID=241820 RepID=UPI0035B255BC
MWRGLSVLVVCWAVTGPGSGQTGVPTQRMLLTGTTGAPHPEEDARSAAAEDNRPEAPTTAAPVDGEVGSVLQDTDEPLEDELDNQENVISQLLMDYDKVKTVSSGSDCVCRCIVRPIKRSDCSRINDSDSSSPFYTVETISKGTDCKRCVCMAPPSAVNPCEGEYRFKKLQEASKDDIKLATIIDLLEGSVYGMDLLKLHSVTTKLLTRVDNMEAFVRNFTERAREKERAKERAKEKEREKKAQQKKKKVTDLERVGQKSGAAAYANKKNIEGQQKNQQEDDAEQQPPVTNKKGSEKPVKNPTAPKQPIKDKNSMVVRGVTFYMAEEESFREEEVEKGKDKRRSTSVTPNAPVDLLISDQVPPTRTFQTKRPDLTTVSSKLDSQNLSQSRHEATQPPSASQTTTKQTPTTAKTTPTTIKLTSASTSDIPPTTTKLTTTPQQTTTTSQLATVVNLPTITPSATTVVPLVAASPESRQAPKSRLSWTERPADQIKTTKKPALCKDTVASISEPVQQNSFGLSDGAWMRDARGHGKVIYLTNGHYGDNLQEFRDMESFKSGQVSNSYKLPFSFTGTGHIVFNGAFYYNRAFSRDIIRYSLRHRYVAAWNTLHDALLEEQDPGTKTEMEFAVDESGLWLLYPAVDSEGFHQEVLLLTQLHHRDLQPIQTFRTGLRRGRYGNVFLICGVLYAVDSMEHHYANVTYAFDTHTLTHTVPSLAFTNMHTHTSQLSYCPLDKKLYAWDNGHQMTYDVIFAY